MYHERKREETKSTKKIVRKVSFWTLLISSVFLLVCFVLDLKALDKVSSLIFVAIIPLSLLALIFSCVPINMSCYRCGNQFGNWNDTRQMCPPCREKLDQEDQK